MKKKTNKFLSVLICLAFLLSLWELIAWYLDQVKHDPMAVKKLPYLHRVIEQIFRDADSLMSAVMFTFTKALEGFFIGALIGIAIAVLMSFHKSLEKMILPYMIVFQMIPILALAPIVYSVVRDQNASRTVLAAFITFFPVAVNMYQGLRSVDNDKKELMRILAADRIVVYAKLMFPFSKSYLFTGLKLAAPAAVTAAILVEMMGSSQGIGFKILSALYYGATGAINFWASVVMASLMGVCTYFLVAAVELLTSPEFLTRLFRRKGGGAKC
ncbi:MAG: ABC transporter permease subunit [Oscillospiraceae bacterium]